MNLLPPSVPPNHKEQPPNPETRRVPVVPVFEPSETSGGMNAVYPFIIFILSVLLIALLVKDIVLPKTASTSSPTTISGEKPQEHSLGVTLRTPETVRLGLSFETQLSLDNPLDRTVSVTIQPVASAAFTGQSERLTLTIAPHARFILQSRLHAETRGGWYVSYALESDDITVPKTVSRPTSIVEPELRVTMDAGSSRTIAIPKNGWIPLTFWYENMSDQRILTPSLTIRSEGAVLSRTDGIVKTVTLRAIPARAKNRVVIRVQAAEALRGRTVDLHTLGLHADVGYTLPAPSSERVALSVSPEPDVLAVGAYVRLFDSRGKRITDGTTPFTPGMPVKLWVNLAVPREARAFKSFNVQTSPAEGVSFTGRTWGNPRDTFGLAKGGVFTWQTSPLPLASHQEPLVGFEIEFTPRAEDAGSFARILESLSIDGVPNFFLTTQHLELGPVSASLANDRFSTDTGIVRKD